MSFDQSNLAIAGKAVRYSFYVVGTVVLALIGIVLLRVTSFFD